MGNLSSLVGGTTEDPRKEGLPCFGIGHGGFNTEMSLRVIDSNFSIMGSPWSAINDTTATYRHGMAGDAMFGYSSVDMGTWNDQLSSNSEGNAAFLGSLHQHDQYPMGMYVDLSPDGMFNGQTIHGKSYTKTFRGRFLINQILPEGCRPRRYFSMLGNSFFESQSMGNLYAQTDEVNLASYRDNVNYTSGSGSAGYNEATKTLITVHNSTTNLVFNRYVSTVDLNSCDSLQEFFDAATVTSGTGSRNGSHEEDAVVVVGDNGYVAYQYRSGNNAYAGLLSPANTYSNAHFGSLGGTTSYGVDGGDPYYNKMNTTWDGKWAAAYQPYYYYGGGCLAFVFSTEDPRRYFKIASTENDANSLLPTGKSSFMILSESNTDSVPVQMAMYGFKNTDRTGTAATTYSNSIAVASIANGGTLMPTKYGYNNLHGGYYSSCYPKFFTVNQWPKDKATA
jgi:hypothetical protein